MATCTVENTAGSNDYTITNFYDLNKIPWYLGPANIIVYGGIHARRSSRKRAIQLRRTGK